MAFTYDETRATDLAKVRFLIQDTDSTTVLFSDAEITAQLTISGTVNRASLACIEALVARYAQKPFTVTLGDTVGADRYRMMMGVYGMLKRAVHGRCTLVVGGRIRADKTDLADDTTLVQPGARKGQDDYHGPIEEDE